MWAKIVWSRLQGVAQASHVNDIIMRALTGYFLESQYACIWLARFHSHFFYFFIPFIYIEYLAILKINQDRVFQWWRHAAVLLTTAVQHVNAIVRWCVVYIYEDYWWERLLFLDISSILSLLWVIRNQSYFDERWKWLISSIIYTSLTIMRRVSSLVTFLLTFWIDSVRGLKILSTPVKSCKVVTDEGTLDLSPLSSTDGSPK